MVRAQRETPLVENEVYVFPTATFILACLLVGTYPPLLPGHVATFRLPLLPVSMMSQGMVTSWPVIEQNCFVMEIY